MKNLFLAAFALLSLAVAAAPAAHAYTRGFPQSTHHSGPYDDTGNGPSQTYGGGD
jgi:Spy/CpxP family protein refolding chaperone